MRDFRKQRKYCWKKEKVEAKRKRFLGRREKALADLKVTDALLNDASEKLRKAMKDTPVNEQSLQVASTLLEVANEKKSQDHE